MPESAMNRQLIEAKNRWRAAGLVLLGTLQMARGNEAAPVCDAPTPEAARARADQLMQQSDYQRAGHCYVAAGEYELANRAFVKAVAPAAMASRQRVAQGVEDARTQARRLEGAFGRHQRK
jgi:hypothetical protein